MIQSTSSKHVNKGGGGSKRYSLLMILHLGRDNVITCHSLPAKFSLKLFHLNLSQKLSVWFSLRGSVRRLKDHAYTPAESYTAPIWPPKYLPYSDIKKALFKYISKCPSHHHVFVLMTFKLSYDEHAIFIGRDVLKQHNQHLPKTWSVNLSPSVPSINWSKKHCATISCTLNCLDFKKLSSNKRFCTI